MDLQDLAQALRVNFGSDNASVRLSEFLTFLTSYQNSTAQPGTAKTVENRRFPSPCEALGAPPTQGQPPTSGAAQSGSNKRDQTSQQLPHFTFSAPLGGTAEHLVPTSNSTAKHTPRSNQTAATVSQKASYATTAAKAGPTSQKRQILHKPAKTYIPERLQTLPKPPKPIRAYFKDSTTLDTPIEEILKGISSKQQVQSIRGLKKASKRLLLVYPTTQEARGYLENTTSEWLSEINGEPPKTLFYIVTHNIDQEKDLEGLKATIHSQNKLQNEILSLERLGKSQSIRIGLQSLEEANTLILFGLVLDHEIRRVYKYIPRQRSQKRGRTSQKTARVFFREPKLGNPAQKVSLNLQDPIDTPMEGQEWTLIESRKRKTLEPESRKARGRPRFTDRRASNQQGIELFISSSDSQNSLEGSQTSQTPERTQNSLSNE
jgi:hypothetical protein